MSTVLAPATDRLAHLSPVLPHFTPLEAERGEGVHLYASDGRRYLDFTSGIGVTNTGHCHPRVVEAVQRQAGRLLHGQLTIVLHAPVLELMEELAQVVPAPLDCFFFGSSGSEAVEGALKLARHATGRSGVVCFQGGYHGRSVGAMALTTAKTVYRERYQPLVPGVVVAPYPYPFRSASDPEAVAERCLAELDHLLHTQAAPCELAAMVVEPVLGEGGYVVPPARFLQGLRERCDRHGILLVFDEIQTGFGRTGAFFALEHSGVVPDVLLMAKGLASGLPLAAIAAPRVLMERWLPGSHGGTYCGNPVAAAAAAETIRVIHDERLVENAASQGALLLRSLREVQRRLGAPGDVRGVGLMVGCEFVDPLGRPDAATARGVRQRCLGDGLILLSCGTYENVIRWIPPLVVTGEQIAEGVEIFAAAVAAERGAGAA
jgi:4-aminobutyrate aminotransferase